MKKVNAAILITCHNRREKTLKCLNALFNVNLPDFLSFDIHLVDDGSSDRTGEVVKNTYPQINVITGSGSLFWNGGMRLAWKTAAKQKDYDFYIWLNDDTMLFSSAITELFDSFYEAYAKEGKPAVIVGSCQSDSDLSEFSYGGRTDKGPVIPNGKLQKCKYINGNIVLISNEIYKRTGNLSGEFTHTMGDFDYGLRATKNGFESYITKGFVAVCSPNPGKPAWCNPEIPIKERWKSLHSPTGLNIKEYIVFRKKHWGLKWIVYALKVYINFFCPKIYSYVSSNH